jgi:hypothetical protein
MAEKEFPKGIRFDLPKAGAPEFIRGRISINVEEFVPYVQSKVNERGWVNFDIKKGKESGKLYLDLNDWKPKTTEPQVSTEKEPYNPDGIDPENIPF